jgi:death on curing protein
MAHSASPSCCAGWASDAAALLQSLARNHPLVDGNERLAWLATYVFLARNGIELDPGGDEA